MSFLKISDPTKRDQTVKEYLELKKNIRDNLLSERTGEQQLQTELTKFYRPITESQKATAREITESQKATAREITEGLRPIREGIESLPQAIQPIDEASGEAPEEEEEDESIGPIARKYLNKPDTDKTFGVRKIGKQHYIGNKHVIITEGLRPIREGIEKLPEAMQPIGEASGKAPEEEKEDELVGDIAIKYLRLDDKVKDKTFGINKIGKHHYIGDTHVIIHNNNIIIDDEKFIGTPGLWELIMLKDPPPRENYHTEDKKNYIKILLKTYVLHQGNNPNNPYPKSSKGNKWNSFLKTIWENRKMVYEGKGIVIMPSDPNALLERLDLLLASQKASHTGVGNELVSICDELKRQGVLNTDAYKKLNSIIKK